MHFHGPLGNSSIDMTQNQISFHDTHHAASGVFVDAKETTYAYMKTAEALDAPTDAENADVVAADGEENSNNKRQQSSTSDNAQMKDGMRAGRRQLFIIRQ